MTSRYAFGWLLAAVVTLLAAANWHFASAQTEKREPLHLWEYKTLNGYSDEKVKQCGDDGWELVAATRNPDSSVDRLYFKRPK